MLRSVNMHVYAWEQSPPAEAGGGIFMSLLLNLPPAAQTGVGLIFVLVNICHWIILRKTFKKNKTKNQNKKEKTWGGN